MGWVELHSEAGDLLFNVGRDPLRDSAPRGQVEADIEEFEDWTEGPKAPRRPMQHGPLSPLLNVEAANQEKQNGSKCDPPSGAICPDDGATVS